MRRKMLKQYIVWFIELIIVCVIFLFLSTKLREIQDLLDVIERIAIIAIVYEFLVYVINNNFMDAQKDQLLAYRHFLELALLYTESREENIKNRLNAVYYEYKNDKFMIDEKYVLEIENVLGVIQMDSPPNSAIADLKAKVLLAQHMYFTLDLKWNNSLLVKIFK